MEKVFDKEMCNQGSFMASHQGVTFLLGYGVVEPAWGMAVKSLSLGLAPSNRIRATSVCLTHVLGVIKLEKSCNLNIICFHKIFDLFTLNLRLLCRHWKHVNFIVNRNSWLTGLSLWRELAGRDKGMMWADVSINDIRTCTHTCSLDCSNTKFSFNFEMC